MKFITSTLIILVLSFNYSFSQETQVPNKNRVASSKSSEDTDPATLQKIERAKEVIVNWMDQNLALSEQQLQEITNLLDSGEGIQVYQPLSSEYVEAKRQQFHERQMENMERILSDHQVEKLLASHNEIQILLNQAMSQH